MNIDDEVSFCNKVLFSRKYKVVHRIQSIIVIKIAKQQVCDEFIEQNVLIEFNKIFLRVKIYLIQNFQSSLIINMNVLKRNDINFQLSRNMLIINEIDVFLNYSSSTLKLASNLNNYIFFHFVIAIDIKIDIKKSKK